MTVNRTTLLDLPLPVTGTESGTWGNTTNNGLTQYLDIAIAGTLVLSTDADVTLTSTEGDSSATNIGATTAQYAILRWTATGSTTRNITALAQSKTYVVINATGGTQSIVLRGAGPTTGVTIISGEKAFCVWNGSDFVKVSSSAAAGGSNTQVQYNSSGVLAGSSNMTFDGTSLTLGGNPTLSAGTANGVLYLNGSKVVTSGSALTFDGTNLATTGTSTGLRLVASSTDASGSVLQVDTTATAFGRVGGSTTMGYVAGTQSLWTIGGSEQMRLTSTGLGIGTSSPDAKLDVTSAGSAAAYTVSAVIQDGTYPASGNPTLEFNGFVGGNGYRSGIGSIGGQQLAFYTPSTFGVAPTRHMTLNELGNVGIGTSSPGAKLELSLTSTTDSSLRLRYNASSIYANHLMNGGGDYVVESPATNGVTSGNMRLRAGSAFSVSTNNNSAISPQLTLDSSGNLGLGVTPSAWSSGSSMDVGAQTSVHFSVSVGTLFGKNVYFNAGYKYKATGTARAYIQDDGGHSWFTAPSGTAGNAITFTQAMTLDASGNLGVGTTSPSTNLVIGGTASGAGSAGSLGVFLSRGVTTNFYEAYDGTKSMIAGVDSNQSFIKIGAFSNHPLAFVTNNGERARITSDGYFKATSTGTYSAGTTGVVHEFDTSSVDGTIVNFYNQAASNPNGIYVGYTAADPNDATRYVFGAQQNTGTWIYRIYSNGTVAARSDVKWKKNIETTRDGYAEDLAKLRVVKYNWYNHEDGTPKELGLIAQEVEQVFPRLVTTDEQTRDEVKTREIPAVLDEEGNEVEPARTEEYTEKVGTGEYSKSIKFSVLPIMLLKAIQEQQALITSLTARVALLEGN